MNVFGFQCFALYFAVVGIFLLFKLNVSDFFSPRQTMKQNIRQAKKGKKNRIREYCSETVQILRLLRVNNPENVLALFVSSEAMLGIFFGSLLNNTMLSIILGLIGIAFPFFVIQFFWSFKDQKMSEALEIALGRITSSYVRPGMTFDAALKENMSELPDMVRPIFERILLQMTYVDADIVKSLRESKVGIHNYIYKEWINAVIRCLDNQSLKPTLPLIVNKFTDQRIIFSETKVLMHEHRQSYFIMTGATILSPLLLFVLHRQWFTLLFTTNIGKGLLVMLAICIAITLFVGLPSITPNYNIGHDIDDLEE